MLGRSICNQDVSTCESINKSGDKYEHNFKDGGCNHSSKEPEA